MTSVYWGADSHCLARDHIFARDGLAPTCTQMPVNILISECEVFALKAIDNPKANMLGLNHVSAQRLVNIAEQQVGSRY